MFELEFCKKFNIVSYQLEKRFYSKKNEVALYSFCDAKNNLKKWVVKHFSSPRRCRKEAKVLKILSSSGLAVPGIIYSTNHCIIMEYIQGETLLAWLEKSEQTAAPVAGTTGLLTALASWLQDAYQALHRAYGHSMILGDVNLRNFVLSECIYGLDFEECRAGSPEEDLGRLCAFVLTYNPGFTLWKYRFVAAIKNVIAAELNLSWQRVFTEMLKELEQMSKRRNEQNMQAALRGNEHGFRLISP